MKPRHEECITCLWYYHNCDDYGVQHNRCEGYVGDVKITEPEFPEPEGVIRDGDGNEVSWDDFFNMPILTPEEIEEDRIEAEQKENKQRVIERGLLNPDKLTRTSKAKRPDRIRRLKMRRDRKK